MSGFMHWLPCSCGRRVFQQREVNRYRVLAASQHARGVNQPAWPGIPGQAAPWQRTALAAYSTARLASPERTLIAQSTSCRRLPVLAESGLLDLQEELGVAARLAHLLHEKLKCLLRLQRVQHAAQLPDDLELFRREQDLLLAGAGRVHVDSGEQPLVGEFAAQPQLHVAGALELLEDDLVHPGAGLDQRGREDRQRAAVLDVARRAEEPLRRVERGRVDAA